MKIFFLILILMTTETYSASWATVKVNKAVVFADKEMTSEVGFLKKDKKVRIGDRARNRGQVYPFVYQKRILYIKTIDIQTSEELLALSSAMERVVKKSTSHDPYQKVAIASGVGIFNLDSSESYDNVNSKSISALDISLIGHFVRPAHRDSFKVLLGSSFATSGVESYKLFNFEIYYQKRILKLNRFSLFVGPGIIWSPIFSYKYDNDFTQNGTGYGVAADLEVNYNISKKFNLSLNANYRYQKLSVDLPETVSIETYSPTLSGAKFYIGFHYLY